MANNDSGRDKETIMKLKRWKFVNKKKEKKNILIEYERMFILSPFQECWLFEPAAWAIVDLNELTMNLNRNEMQYQTTNQI